MGTPEHRVRRARLALLLLNVLAASLYSTAYFETGAKLLDDGGVDVNGVRVFQHLVGGRDDAWDGERTTIHLGADDVTGSANFGLVPYTDQDGRVRNDIYIGSSMDIPGIVHEFGHAVDRAFTGGQTLADAMAEALIEVGVPTGIVYTGIIQGYAAKVDLGTNQEIAADLFMTAVLDGRGFEVYSLGPGGTNPASDRPVGWAEGGTYRSLILPARDAFARLIVDNAPHVRD